MVTKEVAVTKLRNEHPSSLLLPYLKEWATDCLTPSFLQTVPRHMWPDLFRYVPELKALRPVDEPSRPPTPAAPPAPVEEPDFFGVSVPVTLAFVKNHADRTGSVTVSVSTKFRKTFEKLLAHGHVLLRSKGPCYAMIEPAFGGPISTSYAGTPESKDLYEVTFLYKDCGWRELDGRWRIEATEAKPLAQYSWNDLMRLLIMAGKSERTKLRDEIRADIDRRQDTCAHTNTQHSTARIDTKTLKAGDTLDVCSTCRKLVNVNGIPRANTAQTR